MPWCDIRLCCCRLGCNKVCCFGVGLDVYGVVSAHCGHWLEWTSTCGLGGRVGIFGTSFVYVAGETLFL